jgi:hypothetical protein
LPDPEGITQHHHGTGNVPQIANPLLCGDIDSTA